MASNETAEKPVTVPNRTSRANKKSVGMCRSLFHDIKAELSAENTDLERVKLLAETCSAIATAERDFRDLCRRNR